MRSEEERQLFKDALALPYHDRVKVLCILLDDLSKHRDENKNDPIAKRKPRSKNGKIERK